MDKEQQIFAAGDVANDPASLGGVGANDTGLLDALDLPIIVVGSDCKIARINRAATKLFELSASDVGRSLGPAFAGAENLNRLCAQSMADGVPCRRETRDGDRWFVLRIAPYTGTDREILGAVLTFTNVTAFRASIDQAIYEREYTKAILNTVIDPLVVLNAKLQVQTGNRAFYELFSVSRDETQGLSIQKLGNNDWAAWEVWHVIETNLPEHTQLQPVEIERDFPAIGRRTVVLDARRLARDGDALILLTFQDVTDRKEAEEKYRKLAETLDAEVRARTRELEERNADVVRQSEQLRELSWQLLRTQDQERRHIARELHDSAGQTLTILGMKLAQLIQQTGRNSPGVATEAESIQDLVQQLHREIRTTSYLLHPPLLDDIGLSSALGWYIEGLRERSAMDINLDISEKIGRLPRDMELMIFRLIQEALTNVHRHSGSKNAAIHIGCESNRISVEVRDQGKGMSGEKLSEIQSRGSGVGIRGMRERLLEFEGTLNIESGSSGTRVVATIPISANGIKTAVIPSS